MTNNPRPSRRPDHDRASAPTSTGSYLKRLLPMLLAAFLGSTLLQFLFPELNFVVRLLILAVLLLAVSVVLDRLRSRDR
ncbi:O-antigen/teichoic acid export membrane protein [Arthrobacter sp. CAN_A212]|uniref:hypothetical protein n=1 Tax=unclassified Arthrobacter TaxID=235627 RepID=UPI0018CADCF3|nr:hypothetical protein [Arthrobacter sp. CAN_C5]MBP2214923.1 O-antigen/teichoic acid export membrane protein [Arthrobacter sp. CAN_C5]